jgi:serine/threonine protein kinase
MMKSVKGESGKSWEYSPDDLLGKPGGFGEVYRGKGSDGVEVAVKRIRSMLQDGHDLARRLQLREVEIMRKLESMEAKYLIHMLDVVMDEDEVLIVMERADRCLAVPPEGLSERVAMNIAKDVVSGMTELHGAGVIHRDIKPSNVLMHGDKWKLADFGIAHDLDLGTQTYTFKGFGTFAYMAPELWSLHSPNVKTDLYALGCMLFELLIGHTPFQGTTVDEFRLLHTTGKIPEVSQDVNPALRRLLYRLLAKDPASRPQDARAAYDSLQRLSVPLSPALQDLQQLSAVHAEERDAEEAYRLSLERRAFELNAQRLQGISDLREIFLEAVESIESALPDVHYGDTEPSGPLGVQLVIADADASVRARTWPDARSRVKGDTLVLAGEVFAANRRRVEWARLANIAYEVVEGRFVWKVYRFEKSAWTTTYVFGAEEWPHGFSEEHFLDEQQRYFMLHPAMHLWAKREELLTSASVHAFFKEALTLPPDN